MVLGLMPPYSPDDVKQAYKAKAKSAHPDAGGDPTEFMRLREAYDRAQEYVEFQRSRRHWLASAVERYAEHSHFVDELESQGCDVETETADWRRELWGDFAQVAESVVGIRARGPQVDDGFIQRLTAHARILQTLRLLDLTGSKLTARGVTELTRIPTLVRIDLRDTRASSADVRTVCTGLRRLEVLHVAGTRLNSWQRFRLRRRFRKIEFVVNRNVSLDASPRTRIDHLAELAMLPR